MRGSGASPGCAVPGSNRRAQAIHGLLAPYPRTTTSFANFGSEASFPLPFIVCACECICRSRACPRPGGWRVASKLGSYKSRGAEKRESRCSRRTSMQGVRVRGVQGCTTPACWSRTRNHAANANPLQRRPRPEARLLPPQRRPPPEARLLPLQRRPQPEARLLPYPPLAAAHHPKRSGPAFYRLDAGQAQDTMVEVHHAVHCNRPRTITTAIDSVTSAISASGHRLATRSAAGVARRTTPCTISR